ncbi:hypothetical protein VUN84_15885 [Micrococcaceae bacterium Sec5.8]
MQRTGKPVDLAGAGVRLGDRGTDPAPARPTVPARLRVLGTAIAGHAMISQLLYAGLFVQVSAPIGELRQAGELMYCAGRAGRVP